MGTKLITFFFPSRVIGGAEFLFFRLAKSLSYEENYEIAYIDFSDGVVTNWCMEEKLNIKLIQYSGYRRICIDDEQIVVTPLSSIFELGDVLVGNFRVFFWSIHPKGLEQTISNKNRFKFFKNPFSKYGCDIEFLMSKNGVAFMDGPNLYIQAKTFNFNFIDLEFLPIFCLERTGSAREVDDSRVNIAWIGRLSRDKISSLQNIIDHAIQFCAKNLDLYIDLHIIGEGEDRDKLVNSEGLRNFRIIFLGTIVGDELTTYIGNNVDVVFAMGTSSLETASMKKPTVLVDFSYAKIPDTNKFQWLFQSNDFSVGDYFCESNTRPLHFNDIMWCVHKKQHLEIGELCYQYFKENHSLVMVKMLFLKMLACTELTPSDIEKTKFKKSFLFRNLKFIKRYIKSNYA